MRNTDREHAAAKLRLNEDVRPFRKAGISHASCSAPAGATTSETILLCALSAVKSAALQTLYAAVHESN